MQRTTLLSALLLLAGGCATGPDDVAQAQQDLDGPGSLAPLSAHGGTGGSSIGNLDKGIIYGIRGNTATWLTQLELAYYVPSQADNQRRAGDAIGTTGAIGGTTGTDSGWRYCPSGYAAIGLTGAAGQYVDRLQLVCGQIGNPTNRVTLAAVGGTGGTAFATEVCASGGFLSGVTGRAGTAIDQIQGLCRAPDAPLTSALSQTAANPGEIVTITGAHFGSHTGAAHVHFVDNGVNWGEPGNAAAFSLVSWSDASVSFVVPVKDAAGWQTTSGTTATISVIDASGAVSNTQSLAIGIAPTISSVSPTRAAPGDTITVFGAHFGPGPNGGYVHFTDNGVTWGDPGTAAAFQLVAWSDSQIRFVLPVKDTNGWHVTPGTTANVSIVNSANLSTTTSNIAVTSGVVWPVALDTGVTSIGTSGDGHMQTTLTLDASGHLAVSTHTWDTSSWGVFTGFHGAVAVRLFDGFGNTLATFGAGPYGVEGGDSRTDSWSQQLDPSTLDQLAKVSVVNFYDPQYSAASSVWDWIGNNASTISSVAQAVSAIIALF